MPKRACEKKFSKNKDTREIIVMKGTSSCASFSDPDINPANGGGFLKMKCEQSNNREIACKNAHDLDSEYDPELLPPCFPGANIAAEMVRT